MLLHHCGLLRLRMMFSEGVLRAILLHRTVAPGAMTRSFEAKSPIRSLSTSGCGRGPPEAYSIWWLEVSEPTGNSFQAWA